MKVDPENPLAGRDISFSLRGLEPWQAVEVEFIDPRGVAVAWVTERELLFPKQGGVPISKNTLYADGSGAVGWVRVATMDTEGAWSMRLIINGETTTVSYSISQLQLPVGLETVGVELRRYQGVATDTLYSALVPSTLAVDLQGHLTWVMDQLQQRLGLQSNQIPTIYLMGNRNIFEQVGEATATSVGSEPGFFRSGGIRPGIYMRTDFFRTAIQRTLNHEYVHLVLEEASSGRALPAWLNEGIAKYYEQELGLDGTRPDATRILLYEAIDSVLSAARSNTLAPLTTLESQAAWNARADTDLGIFQYAESQMAVRYLTETYGAAAPIDMVRAMGTGSPLAAAILEVTQVQYTDFGEQFADWLKTYEDPRRAAVREYVQVLGGIMDSWQEISRRRAVEVGRQVSLGQRVPIQQEFLSDVQALLVQLLNTSPPSQLQSLHQSAQQWLETVDRWLSLELEYFQTSSGQKLTQANETIPEVNGRLTQVSNNLGSVMFVYNLE